MNTTVLGKMGEFRARQYLEQQRLKWQCSNYRCPQGEVDLIMLDQETLVFVEVRFRTHRDYGDNVETVTTRKQQRLIKAAWHYLIEINGVEKINGRFDVVGLAPPDEIYWIQNAFEVKYSS